VLCFLLAMLLAPQLQLSGTIELPKIIQPEYSEAVVATGGPASVSVTLKVRKGFVINRTPQMQLNLDTVDGLTLPETHFLSPTEDPKSSDSYYVDVPAFRVSLRADRPGNFEIPGELVYFFCNKADGYCSRQSIEVSIPVRAE
jgi:hypothetical protein